MVDPLSVLAELTRFGRALTGAIRRETVADSAKECLDRLFAPRAQCLALTTESPRTFILATASGDPPPAHDDPFLVEVQEAGRVIRHTNPSRLGTPVFLFGSNSDFSGFFFLSVKSEKSLTEPPRRPAVTGLY